MKNNIQGVGVALVTPFAASGKVDFEALGRLVSHVTKGGADYLVVLGTTAETPTLSDDEKREIVECVKNSNSANLPLVLGIGGNSTVDVARKLTQFDLKGVDAILSVTPYYNRPSQEGLYQHYRALAIESPLPIILYNVPSRTGVNMTAQTTLRLAHEVRNILGVKEAGGSLNQMAYILRDRPAGFRVISGDDGLAVALAGMGGDGVISVAANAFPAEIVNMTRAAASGDVAAASAGQLRMLEVIDALFEEGNPTGIKAALSIKGLSDVMVRLPLVPASERLYERIQGLIEKYDL
jgi:4-hydroxy-tetrahydrodipicolinate synthase